MEPVSQYYLSQRLKLHYVCWGDEGKPALLLIHGGRDHCRNWDTVAQALSDQYAIYAPDLRGHGDSDWAVGSMYSLPEFVLDIATLVEVLGREPLTIIGHSLGGAVALQYAGIFPDRVARVVAIEGLGPPFMEHRPAHVRMREWIGHMHEMERRQPRRYATLDDAVQRMREANPHLTEEMAHHLTVYGANRNEDGSYTWKFDNYVRVRSPYEFNLEDAQDIWRKITAPVLLIRGTESWAPGPEWERRAEAISDRRSVVVDGAGHWVHHDQLDAFLDAARAFLLKG
ncbi:MAG: alpha/beta hydrolase [Chloroflexi bacterium]|nr:alpha/beta hydrolase [Chloroflexota bacterium]